MKKYFHFLAAAGLVLLVAACGNNDEESKSNRENEEESEEIENNEDGENQDQEAVEIIENAIEVHEDTTSYHQLISREHENDEFASASETWYVEEEDTESFRQDNILEAGESSTVNYTVIENGEALMYSKEENTLFAFDQEIGDRGETQNVVAQMLTDILENAQITLKGNEIVNSYHTYHITADDGNAVTELWFDQDTYYRVQEAYEGGEISELITVADYELEPEYEEEIFQLDEVVPDDAEFVEEEPNNS